MRGIEKRRIVDDDNDRERFIQRLGELSQRSETAVHAWSLMTNHAHILLRSGPQGLSALVLRWFGDGEKSARPAYRSFVAKGIDIGRQPRLVGGGLIRSAGGWSEIKALRRIGAQEQGDDRILGGGEFVSRILSEAELSKKYRLANLDRHRCASDLIARCCSEKGVSIQALGGGSRMRQVSQVRRELVSRLTEDLGLSFAEVARLLGVSTSAVAKILERKGVDMSK
jgi:putative transposase